MAVYFDTGLLLKLFVTEANSPRVIALAASLDQPLVFSGFQHAELINALHCKAGRSEISAADATAVETRIRLEVKSGALHWREPAWKAVFAQTVRLSQAHAPTTLCRTLDAMHVALALSLRVKQFATLDHRQEALALAAGLAVLKP